MSKKKTRMTLSEVKASINRVGKYYDPRTKKMSNIFGTNKKTKGGKLTVTRKFKTWLRATNKGISKEDKDTIMKEMEEQAKKLNEDAQKNNMSPDKYYTKVLNDAQLGRTKMRAKAEEMKKKVDDMVNKKPPVASGKFSPEELAEREKKAKQIAENQMKSDKGKKDLKEMMEGMQKQKAKEEEDKKMEAKENPEVTYKKPRKPRKKEAIGSRRSKADKKEREAQKIEKIITGEPDVMDFMSGKGSKEAVQKDMSDKLYKDLLNNVGNITRGEVAKLEQEQKEKVRQLPVEQSNDVTDPTSGENNFENVQLAVSDFRNDTGQGIHTDELMRRIREKQDEMQKMIDMIETNPKALTKETQMKTDAKQMMMSERPQSNQFESPREPAREGVQSSEPTEEMMSEPVELRGQVQEQNMGGRQRIRSQRPSRGPPQTPSMQNIDESGLTIPQEVERDAGDGRLGVMPSAVPQMDIQNETIKRNKKTIQQLRVECECFKNIYREQINTKKFKQLMNMDLKKKSLDEIRTIHKHYTEEVRDYYNSHRGLRVGVIIDPAILGLNVQALQGMLAPRVPSYTPAVDAGRRAEGFEQVGGDLRRRPPTGQTPAIADTDVHYKLGGVRHATGKYDRDIESINQHIDRQEDKKLSNFGRSSTRFGKAKTFKNNFYQAPAHTNIPKIRLKTK
tara:strand:+ start:5623 stop:7653 length:2031 start_codon:yes stop_codon:yes gene_type:complete